MDANLTRPRDFRRQLKEVGGYDNDMVGIPAGGVRPIIDEVEQLRAALADDIETLSAIADKLALGSRDRNTFEEIVTRNRALLGTL